MDLALNNPQWLICPETKVNQTKPNLHMDMPILAEQQRLICIDHFGANTRCSVDDLPEMDVEREREREWEREREREREKTVPLEFLDDDDDDDDGLNSTTAVLHRQIWP